LREQLNPVSTHLDQLPLRQLSRALTATRKESLIAAHFTKEPRNQLCLLATANWSINLSLTRLRLKNAPSAFALARKWIRPRLAVEKVNRQKTTDLMW
jgi:hypothetical protein